MAYVIVAPLFGFIGPMRVGQGFPPHGDKVRLAGLENILRHARFCNAPHSNDRYIYKLLCFCGKVLRPAVVLEVRGDNPNR